jgi:hypothetical protein
VNDLVNACIDKDKPKPYPEDYEQKATVAQVLQDAAE